MPKTHFMKCLNIVQEVDTHVEDFFGGKLTTLFEDFWQELTVVRSYYEICAAMVPPVYNLNKPNFAFQF